MTEIRSYRRVFDLERRVYSIDRVRLNPAGVPVRGVVYLVTTVAAVLVAGALPLLRDVAGLAPWYLRDIGLPAALAAALALLRIDGRSFHTAALAILARGLRARRLASLAGRSQTHVLWWPPPIVMLPDGSDAAFRRLRYRGPGAVHIRRVHRRRGIRERDGSGLGSRRRALCLSADPGGDCPAGTVIVLARTARLEVQAERPDV